DLEFSINPILFISLPSCAEHRRTAEGPSSSCRGDRSTAAPAIKHGGARHIGRRVTQRRRYLPIHTSNTGIHDHSWPPLPKALPPEQHALLLNLELARPPEQRMLLLNLELTQSSEHLA
ncbi:unnamed protein product, partial [Urochloa humidicola]